MEIRTKPRLMICTLATVLWGLGVGLGLIGLLRYKARPGAAGDPAVYWPSDSALTRDPQRSNLVLALHPRCPCSSASLAEFARIIARCQGRVAGHVLFVKPGGTPRGWEQTGLWREVAALPGVRVTCDEAGREADRFGVETSGHVALYGPEGRLRFSGGITPARGHQGDNPGLQAVLARLLGGEAPGTDRGPVFGCPLFGPGRRGGDRP
jgi:hypothetical protein